jgi:hypothetical protein
MKTGIISRVSLVRADVLHSLGLPSVGVKLDATPGRISITVLEIFYPGLILGSCYELCGRGHRAMPVHLLSFYRFKLNRLRAFKALRQNFRVSN